MRLLILLVGVPTLELFLLLRVKDATSWTFTIALTFITGIVGASLARQQGFATLQKIQQEVSSRQVPAKSLVDAVMILIAGLLLMTPGILTDIFGFSLLVPPVRTQYRRLAMIWIRKNVKIQTVVHGSTPSPTDKPASQGMIIDSHVVPPKDEP